MTLVTGDVKEALQLWLKNKTVGYRDVVIENFTKSFHDGLAVRSGIFYEIYVLVLRPNSQNETQVDSL